MEAPVNYFTELYKIDVSKHVEKKNGFSYVSWPFAVAELRKRHPEATWEVARFDGLPYQSTPAGVFVEVAVTVQGVRLSQIHPVLNHANRPIKEPTAFDINTSIQRALVKAIALHGLGLFVYAGEDLPESEKDEPSELEGQLQDSINAIKAKAPRTLGMQVRQRIQEHLAAGRELGALQEWQALRDLDNGHEVASIVWGGLTTPERQEITRLQNEAKEHA